MILRPARPDDAAAMCDVLNPIIAAGGTTAHRRPFDADRMLHHYIASPLTIGCTVAVTDRVVGFQSLARPDPTYEGDALIPDDWGIIATFVTIGATQGGIGTALFAETRKIAKTAGLLAIDATIRRENTGGRAYYTRMGFTDYRDSAETVSKRFDLT